MFLVFKGGKIGAAGSDWASDVGFVALIDFFALKSRCNHSWVGVDGDKGLFKG